MNNEEEKTFNKNIFYPIGFLILIWIVKLIEEIFNLSFAQYGLVPKTAAGLIGIITAPLIHADFNHLISNSIPLVFLGIGMFYFFPSSSVKTAISIYIIPNICVWFFGRSAYHIGASGIIYGLVAFLFFSGVIKRDVRSIALSLIVTFLYGSLVWGVLPIDNKVSYETHLFGALTGIICAFIFRKNDPYKKYEWEKENDEEDDNEKPEISYTKGYPWDE